MEAIHTATRALTGIGAITRAQLHLGTPLLRDALDDLAARATSSVHVDVFRVGDDSVVAGLERLGRRDVSLSVLADTDQTTGKLARRLREAADSWDELGADPLKQHGKTASRDGGLEALVATDIADDGAALRMEVGASFDGAAARALHDVQAAGSDSALVAALDVAAGRGVVINDPRVAVQHATTAVELLLAARSGPIKIATKAFDSKRLAAELAARAAHQPIEIVTHHMPESQKHLLREAGAIVRIIKLKDAEDAARALHGTIIRTNDHVLLGSLFLEQRVLYGSNGRQSREAAVVLGADAATEARRVLGDAIDSLVADLG